MCIAAQAPPGQRPPPQFMAAPAAIPGLPPGLEYLAQIDQLLVHQQVEIFERMYSRHPFHTVIAVFCTGCLQLVSEISLEFEIAAGNAGNL